MNYFEAPADHSRDRGTKVFLAGGIGACEDWQQEITGYFNGTELTILNPRREKFEVPWSRAASEEQIGWEYAALRDADIVLFWFAGGPSAQPIALFELGVWGSQSNTPIVVGCDPTYTRINDIEIQLRLMRGRNFPVYRSLAAVAEAVELAASRLPRRWF